ncbi:MULTISPECIES: TniB family NTP-binding protein [Ralstonia]|jgi:Bacterial TniB protein|uniref:Transposase n=2 Tax=Ralstonia pickettii TaxID=329 RepID=A0ABN9I2C6_RALPI|nr:MULTISPECIES: TniB family NTP-binding protein [Ralstonia]MCL6486873.1 TniB family NTP-binding protein [Janthinobacterium lividum]MBA4200885.1 transposase [Ralstonia sp.]MBA4230688.1 transposase [Ralstonia sp.]MBA4237664.1 transposase [Ralstonia sp.]MBA4402440.1 transposase [Ralstonia sp.]
MTQYMHVHPDFLPIMALSGEERIAAMDQPRWIGYPRAIEILDLLQGLLTKPKRPRMPNLLIVGDSNNGKTTLIERFRELCGTSYVDGSGDPVRPVVIAEAPTSADERSLYVSVLERFWTPYKPTDSIPKLRYQLIHLMRACNVQMLVLDEMHSLLTGTTTKQREVMNALKLLCNELRIPIVGVGTREAVRVLHTDPQHASRFDVASLPAWSPDKEFQRLLASFERVLPLKHPSRLHAPELASRLHAISEGNIGNLHRLLVACATQAIRAGSEQIDVAIVEKNQWIRPTRGIRELFA